MSWLYITPAQRGTKQLGLALSPEDSKCTGNLNFSPDQEITGCTNAIQSGKYSGKDLSLVYYNRGSAYYALDDRRKSDLAIADYSEVIRLDPKSASAYFNRGGAYSNKRDYDRAIADLNEAIRLDPKDTLAQGFLGDVYRMKGDYERTFAHYSEAIRLMPKFFGGYHSRGLAYFNKGDYDRAIADFSEAIRLEPKFTPVYDNRGDAYFAKGDYGRAIEDSTEAIKLDGKNAYAYKTRGVIYHYGNSLAQAKADFEQAVNLAPKNAYAALWLDIAERRSNLPSHLAEAAKRLDMGAWPAPVVRLFLGEATLAAVLAAADDADPIKKKGQVCEANFYSAEYALLQNKKDEALRLYKLAASDCPLTFLEARAAKAALARIAK